MAIKSLITSLFLIAGIGLHTAAHAAPGTGPGGKGNGKGFKLKEELGLTDEQAKEMRSIFKDAKAGEKCGDLESKDERRSCAKSKKDEMDQRIAKVLTAEQMHQFREMRREKMKKGKGGPGKHKGMGREK